jgi:hypothetical protein
MLLGTHFYSYLAWICTRFIVCSLCMEYVLNVYYGLCFAVTFLHPRISPAHTMLFYGKELFPSLEDCLFRSVLDCLLCDEELHNLYSSPNIVRIKSTRRWAGNVASTNYEKCFQTFNQRTRMEETISRLRQKQGIKHKWVLNK